MKRKASSPRKFWLLALLPLALLALFLLRPSKPKAPDLPLGQIYPKGAFDRPPAVYRFSATGNKITASLREKMQIVMVTGKPGRLLIKVLDSNGKILRTLADLNDPQGSIQLDWDGSLAPGQPAEPGNYVVLVEGPDKKEKVRVQVLP